MAEAILDNEKDFTPSESALSDDLSSYISVLAQRGRSAIIFRTGAGRIFRDLLLHWPIVINRENQAQELCQNITDVIYPLTGALFAQAVEITATISPTPIAAPANIEAMSTYLIFDTEKGLERHCFLSAEHPLPQDDMLITQAGLVVLCRPLNYQYHTTKDDRELKAHPLVGLYELVERQLNALCELPEFTAKEKPSFDSISSKIAATKQSSLSPSAEALEIILMAHVTDKNLSPALRMELRQIVQNLRKEATRQQSAPSVVKIILMPAPHPQLQEPIGQPTPLPVSLPVTPLALAALASPFIMTSSPVPTPAPQAAPQQAAQPPAKKSAAELAARGASDARNGMLPDPMFSEAGDHYYQNAYDAYMAKKKKNATLPQSAQKQEAPLAASSAAVQQPAVQVPSQAVSQPQVPRATQPVAVEKPAAQTTPQPQTPQQETTPSSEQHAADQVPSKTKQTDRAEDSKRMDQTENTRSRPSSPRNEAEPSPSHHSTDNKTSRSETKQTNKPENIDRMDQTEKTTSRPSSPRHETQSSSSHQSADNKTSRMKRTEDTTSRQSTFERERPLHQPSQEKPYRTTAQQNFMQHKNGPDVRPNPAGHHGDIARLRQEPAGYRKFSPPPKSVATRQPNRFFTLPHHPLTGAEFRPRGLYDRLKMSFSRSLPKGAPFAATGKLSKANLINLEKSIIAQSVISKSFLGMSVPFAAALSGVKKTNETKTKNKKPQIASSHPPLQKTVPTHPSRPDSSKYPTETEG